LYSESLGTPVASGSKGHTIPGKLFGVGLSIAGKRLARRYFSLPPGRPTFLSLLTSESYGLGIVAILNAVVTNRAKAETSQHHSSLSDVHGPWSNEPPLTPIPGSDSSIPAKEEAPLSGVANCRRDLLSPLLSS